MKRSLSMLLAGVMLVGTLAGCGGGASDDAATDNGGADESTATGTAFKIGGTAPLTGDAAIYGNAVARGAQIAADEINAEGGVQIELKFEDDENNTEKAVNAYNNLKDWGMQLSLGSVTSKPCEAISTDINTDRIFALTPSASSVATTEGKDNVFQMCFADPNQGTATDFSVQLNDAKSKGADLIFLPMYYTPASLILTQANSMGYAPKFFGVDGMDGILTVENFDTSLAEGVMLLTPFNADATDDKTVAFVEKYKEEYGEVPNQFAADAYDCIYAYAQALEAAGATPDMSNEELCDAMIEQFTSMTFNGLTGENMTWDTTGAVSKSPKGMVIENGAYVGM